jgi:uncharacterized protein YbjQ (UPF0145 family)
MSTPFGRKPAAGAGGGVEPRWVTTANGFEGHRIAEYRGVVRGIVVRSRSVLGNIGASVQTFFGGNISLYTDLCERARQDAYGLMLRHAAEAGANRDGGPEWPPSPQRSSRPGKPGALLDLSRGARRPSARASRTRSPACA